MLETQLKSRPRSSSCDGDPSDDELALKGAKPETTVVHGGSSDNISPTFSIRDYAITQRTKDVSRSWPFPQELLRFPRKYGVKDLLPPFELGCLVKRRFRGREVGCDEVVQIEDDLQISKELGLLEVKGVDASDQEPLNSSIELDSSSDPSVVEAGSNHSLHPLSEKIELDIDRKEHLGDKPVGGKTEFASARPFCDEVKRTMDRVGGDSRFASEVDIAKQSPLAAGHMQRGVRDPAVKKCRLVLKLGANPSICRRTEDAASNSSVVSDPMASKVCPVCRSFTSSSNTTLNAHIDQCLSHMETGPKIEVGSNSEKFKFKARVRRLMTDIYATAPHCTLEDLDRRNGTNWASDLASVAPVGGVSTVTKLPRLTPARISEGAADGAVYIDSNGIKLRILSNFNDTPTTMPSDIFKVGEPVKETMVAAGEKLVKRKFSNKFKTKTQKRKASTLNICNNKIDATTSGTTASQEDDPLSLVLSTQEQEKITEHAPLRPWVRAKRSSMKGKMANKELRKKPLIDVDNAQPESCAFSDLRSHDLMFSTATEDLASLPGGCATEQESFESDKLPQRANSSSSSEFGSPSFADRVVPESLSTGLVVGARKPFADESNVESHCDDAEVSESLLFSGAQCDEPLFMEELVENSCVVEAHSSSPFKATCRQERQPDDIFNGAVVAHNIHTGSILESRIADSRRPLWFEEFRNKTASAYQYPSTCFSNHDKPSEIPRVKPLPVSSPSTRNYDSFMDMERSLTPVLTASSTISHPSVEYSEGEESKLEFFSRPNSVRMKSISSLTNECALPSFGTAAENKGWQFDYWLSYHKGLFSSMEHAMSSSEDKSYCCQCRGSLSAQLQLRRPCGSATTTIPDSEVMHFASYPSKLTASAAPFLSSKVDHSIFSTVTGSSVSSLPRLGGFGSLSPFSQSTPVRNPVLRLMGKDLVVNRGPPPPSELHKVALSYMHAPNACSSLGGAPF